MILFFVMFGFCINIIAASVFTLFLRCFVSNNVLKETLYITVSTEKFLYLSKIVTWKTQWHFLSENVTASCARWILMSFVFSTVIYRLLIAMFVKKYLKISFLKQVFFYCKPSSLLFWRDRIVLVPYHNTIKFFILAAINLVLYMFNLFVSIFFNCSLNKKWIKTCFT